MSRRSVAIALLWACASAANAGFPSENFTYRWEVLPKPPTTRSPIVLRHIVTGCNPASRTDDIGIDLAAGTIDMFMELGSDACDDRLYFDDYRDSIVGYLPAGSYTVRFFTCRNPIYPEILCLPSGAPNVNFVVSEAGRARQTIPTWSFAGAFGTVLLLAGIALFRLKPR